MGASEDLASAFFTGRTGLRMKPDVRYRVIDHDALLLRQETAEVLGLNQVGTRVLEAIIDGTPGGELVALLEDEFEVERLRLEGDLRQFVAELLEQGLLEAVSPAEL